MMTINLKTSFVSVVALLVLSVSIFSQNTKIDSLKNIIKNEVRDTLKVDLLNTLSSELLTQGEIAESLKYCEEAKNIAIALKYTKGKAYALKQIGLANYYQGNYVEVFDNWTESLENFEVINDSLGIANMLNNLGTVYYSQGANAKAIDYYLRSLRVSEELGHQLRIATALVNLAGIYGDNPQDYSKALNYYDKAYPYLEGLNNIGFSKAYYFGVGEIFYKKENYVEALKIFEEALKVTRNSLFYSDNLYYLGKVKFKLGNIEEAVSFLNQAYLEGIKQNQKISTVKTLIELGIIYRESNFKEALRTYEEAEEIAKELNLTYELSDIYEGISITYVNQGDYKNGYKYHSLFSSKKDSLFNLESDDKIRGLQFDFDLEKKEDQIGLLEKEAEIQQLNEKRQKIVIYASIIALVLIFLLTIGLYKRYKFVNKTNLIIEEEKNRSETLLLNILPEETAQELKLNGKVQAKKFESVTVLFTDFKGFTDYAHNLSPEELVNSVDYYFSKFDEIMDKYGMEKIKTIGDAYMCAGGLPFPSEGHPIKMIDAAFEITEFIEESKKLNNKDITHFDVRIGINTGPVVAGVVGIKKFAYDIWGDTVNVASRMETKSAPGRINISENTYKLVRDEFDCKYRGEIDVKNRGMMKMYFVNARKKKPKRHIVENEKNVI